MKHIRFGLLLLAGITIFWSCQTTAKKKSADNPKGLKKAWHDLNSRFNGYFNANLIVLESINNLSDQYQDNYNQVLALYKESAIEDSKSAASQLDEAIKKSAVAISLHRPSKWSDDAYFLIGQSQYLKKEYDLAVETFDWIVKEYDPKNIEQKKEKASSSKKKKKRSKKKKKKGKSSSPSASRKAFQAETSGEDGESYFLKHRPIREEAMVWLARTQVELGRYDDAQTTVRKLQNSGNLQQRLQAEAAIVESYIYLKQKLYDRAVEPLNRGIELTSNKRKKTRYAYILAQIHQLNGRAKEAAETYDYVLKLRPEYDMEFRTRLNLILNSWESGGETTEVAINKLTKMAKDSKNEEFRDQVYFSMAMINIKEENMSDAVANLKSSLKFNSNNIPQKTESYLNLAQIYFQQEKYVESKNYYDSTLSVISNKDERYTEVKNYSQNLTEIANQLNIIELQDSLLMISRMDEKERKALANKIKKEFNAQNAKPQISSVVPKGFKTLPGISQGSRTLATTGTSSWWAYDVSSVKKGKKDFEKKWGERQLEDNWRRSNRRDIILPQGEEVVEEVEEVFISDTELKQILRDVPDTPEEVAIAEGKIADAMFKLAGLYREKLGNERLAVETLEELIRRFPGNDNELEALYTLYVLHLTSNPGKADSYKQMIVSKYPKSRHAEILRNPDAATVLQAAEMELTQYYNTTYNSFEEDRYQQAFKLASQSDSLFGSDNILRPKFALLAAMCVGSLEGKDPYVAALQKVVKDFPNTDEERKARELLTYLGGRSGKLPNIGSNVTDEDQKGLFKESPNDPHYILAVLSNKNIKISQAKAAVADYHGQYHSLDNLKVSSLLIDLETPILIIRRFSNGQKATEYYESALNRPAELLGQLDPGFKLYPISQTNYKTLLRVRKLQPYILYYEEQNQ
ncbi:MAG: tetratricopeptide repeat protein [Bacteroidota bacterium]